MYPKLQLQIRVALVASRGVDAVLRGCWVVVAEDRRGSMTPGNVISKVVGGRGDSSMTVLLRLRQISCWYTEREREGKREAYGQGDEN